MDAQRDAENTAPPLGLLCSLCMLALRWQRRLICVLTSPFIPYLPSRTGLCQICAKVKEEISNISFLRVLWSLGELPCEQKGATNKLQQPLGLGQGTAGTVPPLTTAGFGGSLGLNPQTMCQKHRGDLKQIKDG